MPSQFGGDRAARLASVGAGVFLFGGEFGGVFAGEGVGGVGEDKERVIAEAVLAARVAGEASFEGAAGGGEDVGVGVGGGVGLRGSGREDEGHGADEAGGASVVGDGVHEAEEFGVVGGVALGARHRGEGGLADFVGGEASGADARVAVECVDFETRVVGEAGLSRERGVGAGFEEGVAEKGVGVFDGFGRVAEAGLFEGEQREAGGGEDVGEFGDLVLVVGREDDGGEIDRRGHGGEGTRSGSAPGGLLRSRLGVRLSGWQGKRPGGAARGVRRRCWIEASRRRR